MQKIKVIIERCPQNHKCPAIKVCSVNALSQKGFDVPIVDYECGKCANFCPKKALVLEDTK